MEKAKILDDILLQIGEESWRKRSEELMAYIDAREQIFRDSAQQVFDAVLNYPADDPQLVVVGRDPLSKKFIIKNPVGDALDEAISKSLNHRSIGYFMELILKNHESAKQVARALKRHTENHAMKADVFAWLDSNMVNFKSMDSAAESISKTVAPIAFRTARDWIGEWKKLRSAGTP